MALHGGTEISCLDESHETLFGLRIYRRTSRSVILSVATLRSTASRSRRIPRIFPIPCRVREFSPRTPGQIQISLDLPHSCLCRFNYFANNHSVISPPHPWLCGFVANKRTYAIRPNGHPTVYWMVKLSPNSLILQKLGAACRSVRFLRFCSTSHKPLARVVFKRTFNPPPGRLGFSPGARSYRLLDILFYRLVFAQSSANPFILAHSCQVS